MRQRDRKSELVEIAYRLIARNGLEGFRIRQVAAEAEIDNGTLHYHFPSKEALILGVVDYLMLERGIQQGIFRNNLNVPLCARAMMVALRGIGYQSRLPRRKVDELLSELAAQTERWITAEDAPQ